MKSPLLRLLLVRHGEAEANRHGGFLGRTDSPLTATGQGLGYLKLLLHEGWAAVFVRDCYFKRSHLVFP